MEEIVYINTDQLLIKRQVFYKFHILDQKGWKGTVVNQACTPLLIKSHLKAHRESV